MTLEAPVDIAGVDGCKGGWIAVFKRVDQPPVIGIYAVFSHLIEALSDDAIIVVDMPIGLPERTGPGGRGPESIVRGFLGPRRSSVFSIPSRGAVYAATHPFSTLEAWYADHRTANAVARETSDPSRGVSIQAFAIFQKIREIDALLRERPDLRGRVFESHPEVALWRLNDRQAMAFPKKVKGSVNPAGMEERKALLRRSGFDPAFLSKKAPSRAATDDFLDACAMLLIAARCAGGVARSYPHPLVHDEIGLPVAIWA